MLLPALVIVQEKRALLVMILGTHFDQAIEDKLEKANIAACPDAPSSSLVPPDNDEESDSDDDSVSFGRYAPSQAHSRTFSLTHANNLFASPNTNSLFGSTNPSNRSGSPNTNSLFGSTTPIAPAPNGSATSAHGLLTPSRSPASSGLSPAVQSTPSRISRRRSDIRSRTPCTVINEASIRSSASAYDIGQMSVIGPPVVARVAGGPDAREAEALLDSTTASRTTAVYPNAASRDAQNGPTSATNRSVFDMSNIADALDSVTTTAQNSAALTTGRSPRAIPYNENPAARRSRNLAESGTEDRSRTTGDHGDAVQHEIGYGGELFVRIQRNWLPLLCTDTEDRYTTF